MKKSSAIIFVVLVLVIISATITSCKKTENPIKYAQGTFPDSLYNLTGLNSQYDDYNSTIYLLEKSLDILFSSNRGSTGGQFDLVQGSVSYQFDQTTGAFNVSSTMLNEPFVSSLINKANTTGNELGPYSRFSSTDGYEYLFFASQNTGVPLNLYYLKYLPVFGSNIPEIIGPDTVKLLNSSFDDAYISFDNNMDSAYFTSNRGGNFDIYLHSRPVSTALDSWANQSFAASTLVDSINSIYDDKCPFVFKNVMVFASNRLSGMGGYDLYYSVFRNGKWSSPVNLGPSINTSSDEFRPILVDNSDYKNLLMIFSSDKPGGKGGFDLYFTGITFPL
jgi:hypothetical protein